MRKLAPERESRVNLGAVKLYRDDVDILVSELMGKGYRLVSISDFEYAFDSLQELEERRGKEISSLDLTWRSDVGGAEIAVRIARWRDPGVTIRFWGPEHEDGSREFLLRIFEERRRLHTRLGNSSRLWGFLVFATPVIGIVFRNPGQFWWWVVLWALSFAVFTLSTVGYHRGSLIDLRHRHDASFWERNKDAMLSNLIVGIVSASVGFAAGTAWDGWFKGQTAPTDPAKVSAPGNSL